MNTTITIKCKNGHVIVIDLEEVNPNFEVVETEEREMGVEKCYESEITVTCDTCGEEVTVKLDVWEYPDGAFNHQKVTVDNGEVIDECDLWPFVSK